MIFKEAYEALKQGANIKLPEWSGYWAWEDDSIKMHCKDGRILDIRETENLDYTLSFILRDDWYITGDVGVSALNIQTFTFGDALRRLKAGKKVARKGWNGKGMFLFLTKGSIIQLDEMKIETANHLRAFYNDRGMDSLQIGSHIDMKAADNSVVIGWLASQTDMLAEDWIEIE